jgi:SpoVK/Ycf46/Vps4 family AAA+-type ATPase
MTVASAPSEAAAVWRADNAEWLRLSLRRLRLRLQRRACWLHRATEDRRSVDWLLAADDPALERRFLAEHAGVKAIDAATAMLDAELAALERRMRAALRPPALLMLGELMALGQFERDLILLAAAPALDGSFARAYAELHDDPCRTCATLHLALALLVDEPADRVLAADSLLPTGSLRSLRAIEVGGDPSEPLLTRALLVDERIADYLRGVNRSDSRLRTLLSRVRPAMCSESADRLGGDVAGLIAAEPSRWLTINLVGTVADGACDVAQRACSELGLDLHTIDLSRLAARPPEERTALTTILAREAALAGTAVLADASQIERGTPAAAAIDELIEELAATLFVVSLARWPGAGAGPVVHIRKPTRPEQCTLWRAALGAHRHSVNGEVEAIAQQFDFGPPAIADAVARAALRSRGAITGHELWRACREQRNAALDELATRITPCYGWDDIVVGDDVREQLRELSNQVEQRGRVYETWGFGAQLGRGRGITALFAGPSGTGKTMAAEILAAHLDLDLYRIDLASVLSKYIGEMEKSLRRVFDAAERGGAILFFDEADALFGTRTEVRDSHDRYANVEINYLLQRMEDYAGLAILATNRRAALDAAFLRRLRFVIDFPFPAADDRRRIWEGVFPPQAELDAVEYAFLSRLELTGGNIRSIAVNAAFLAAAGHAPIGMPHLVRAAAREYMKLSKPISAAEFGAYYDLVRP